MRSDSKRFLTLRSLGGIALILAVAALPLVVNAQSSRPASGPKSAMKAAPNFKLKSIEGKEHALKDFRGKWVVLEWVNHGCPYVIKHYDCGNMQAVQKKYTDKGVVWLSICSSAPGKQGHMSNEEWMKANKAKKGAATAVLIDEDGAVGHMYKARTTPHMFIIDPKGNVTYEGAIDDNPRGRKPAQVKAAKNYVAMVLDAVMAGKPAPVTKTKAYGCSVKYAGKGMKKGRRGGA